MKPLVALYKAYRGGEWFRVSLESIRRQCAGAVVVFADRPWNSTLATLPNNCRHPLEEFRAAHPDFRTVTCQCDASHQEEQYDAGLERLRAEFGAGVSVLIIDTDEVWEDLDLAALRQFITNKPSYRYFTSRIHDHVKSPLYRIDPQPENKPMVALRSAKGETCQRGRFCRSRREYGDFILDVPVSYYHYPYVRLDWDEIPHKLLNTGNQDGPVRTDWFQEVWPVLPWGGELHPDARVRAFWMGVRVMSLEELPEALRASPDLPKLLGCGHGPGLSIQPQFHRFQRPFGNPHCQIDGLAQVYWAADCPDEDAVEVGSWAGESAEIGCQYVRKLHCVDLWGSWTANDRTAREVEALFDARVVRWPDRIVKMKMSSAEAATRFTDGSLGIVYLDGDHAYESVRDDIAAWLPKVRSGGCLAGHDYVNHPGVIQAVNELASSLGFAVRTFCDTSWLMRLKR